MVKWEYKFLMVDWANGSWRVYKDNGAETEDWKNSPSYIQVCNQLGEEGWEMVTLSYTPVFNQGGEITRDFFRIVMKRPKG